MENFLENYAVPRGPSGAAGRLSAAVSVLNFSMNVVLFFAIVRARSAIYEEERFLISFSTGWRWEVKALTCMIPAVRVALSESLFRAILFKRGQNVNR